MGCTPLVGVTPSPPRLPALAGLGDGVPGANLDAGQAAGAERGQQPRAERGAHQGPLGAGGQAGAAGRAAAIDEQGGGHGPYPRGVTIRPKTTLVVEAPTTTQVGV